MNNIKAPFAYFGGKGSVASMVWRRIGDVPWYVEPFFGSGAVLLARPHVPKFETVNDLDGLLVNFWRSVKKDPESVVMHYECPLSEIDLLARHTWLLEHNKEIQQRISADPNFCDTMAAAFWVYVQSGSAIKRGLFTERASPQVASYPPGGAGALFVRGELLPYLEALRDRLSGVAIRSGDWHRCVQSSTMLTGNKQMAGVFLDPPYPETDAQYETGATAFEEARAWAFENGRDRRLRICLCGYYDGTDPPAGWDTVAWKATGGHGNKAHGTGRANARRERLWFSPHCLSDSTRLL